MNFLTVDVLELSDDSITVQSDSLKTLALSLDGGRRFSTGVGKPDRVVIGVRPQYLVPDETGEGMLTGTVTLTERLGSETIVDVSLRSGGKVIAAISEDCLFDKDSSISLRFDPGRAHVFACEPTDN